MEVNMVGEGVCAASEGVKATGKERGRVVLVVEEVEILDDLDAMVIYVRMKGRERGV